MLTLLILAMALIFVQSVVLWAASISHLGVVVEVKVFRQHLEAMARHDVAEGVAAE